MNIDMIVLIGKGLHGREEEFSLSSDSEEGIAAEIEQIKRANPWATEYEYYSGDVEVMADGVPLDERDE